MRWMIIGCCLHLFSTASAQKGNELLVYSLKGNVTVIEDHKESKLKIGKVIKPGSLIKTHRDAQLTMVCKEGKPISITRQGDFPVELFRDSCVGKHGSVTTRYFRYIWDQLYVRSEDYKREHPDGLASEAPVRGHEEKTIFIDERMDTVNYATGSFVLSWSNNFEYEGVYRFVLVNTKTKKEVYKDSSAASTRLLSKLKRFMKPGNSYSWSVYTKETGNTAGGVINYVPAKTVSQLIQKLKNEINVPEAQAAQYFRIAFGLQEQCYFADAHIYFQKAVEADPSTIFYKEILTEFETKSVVVKN